MSHWVLWKVFAVFFFFTYLNCKKWKGQSHIFKLKENVFTNISEPTQKQTKRWQISFPVVTTRSIQEILHVRSTQYSLVGEIAVSDICEYYQYWSYMPRGRVCTIIFLVFLYILYIFLNVCYYYYYYYIDLVLFFFLTNSFCSFVLISPVWSQ